MKTANLSLPRPSLWKSSVRAAVVSPILALSLSAGAATTLSVNGQTIEGVSIEGASFNGGQLNIELAPNSNEIRAEAVAPVFEIPTDQLCSATNQSVACTGEIGFLQNRVLSDSIELTAGVTYASEFVLSAGVNPNLLVFEFRSFGALLPSIDVYLSSEPGGAPLGSGNECVFNVNGYVGSRIRIAHDGSNQVFKDKYCDITRGERYFLNLSLNGNAGSASMVGRTIRLAGI